MDDYLFHTITSHNTTKMDVLPKTYVQIILAAKWLVSHSRTSPNQQRQPWAYHLYLYPSSMGNDVYLNQVWLGTVDAWLQETNQADVFNNHGLSFLRRVYQSRIVPFLCMAVHKVISFCLTLAPLLFLFLFIGFPKAGRDAKKQIEKEKKRELNYKNENYIKNCYFLLLYIL